MKPWLEYCDSANWHEAANIFPLMPEDELQKLADDIKANGLKNPIILLDDKVLDGRNRLLACKLASVTPDFQSRNAEKLGSPTAWVLSQNLHRRQLTATQRAFIAVEAEKLFAIEAKQRMLAGKEANPREKVPEGSKGRARDKAAKALDVNPRYVSDAKKITERSPDVAAKAKAGDVSMAEAKKATSPPKNPELVAAIQAHEKTAKDLAASLKQVSIDGEVYRSKTAGKFHVTLRDLTAEQVSAVSNALVSMGIEHAA